MISDPSYSQLPRTVLSLKWAATLNGRLTVAVFSCINLLKWLFKIIVNKMNRCASAVRNTLSKKCLWLDRYPRTSEKKFSTENFWPQDF